MTPLAAEAILIMTGKSAKRLNSLLSTQVIPLVRSRGFQMQVQGNLRESLRSDQNMSPQLGSLPDALAGVHLLEVVGKSWYSIPKR